MRGIKVHKREVEERGREIGKVLVKGCAKSKMGERGREVIHRLVEHGREGEVGEEGRKRGKRMVESGAHVARQVAKSKVGKMRR